MANYDLDSVSILLGDGFGGFSAPTTFVAGTHPIAVVVGDFDADGKQDLAVANTDSNNVSILLGNGMGGFSAPRNFRVGIYPFSLVLGDFNGDGNQDLAVGNFGAATVSILLGDGTGRFAGPRDFALPHPPHFLAVGDFNGDGKQDLAVDAPPALSILVGDGMGGFGAAGNFNISNTSFWVVVGDFNNDAMQDLALPDLDSSNVSILMRDCSATPTPTPSPQPGGCVMGEEPYQNNPSLWCVETIMVGCQTYTRDQAIAMMRHRGGGDKTFDVFAETVAAKLNIMCKHSDSSCIAIAVAAADAFLCAHPPGSGVTENSAAWQQFKPTYKQIEKYNDGKSCAPKCHDA